MAATTNLRDFWRLDEPELGRQDFLYYADGTAHKNRMQGNDFVTSRMYLRGVTCFTGCHADKSNAWAIDALRSWPEYSPWRVGEFF